MTKAIEDVLKGKGSNQWRYVMRRVMAQLCDRCGRTVTDERVSWKDGVRKMVKRRTCIECVEKQVRNKLYPQQ